MGPDENVKRDDERPLATTQGEVVAQMGREGYVRSVDRATGEVREFAMWVPASGLPQPIPPGQWHDEKGNGDAE